MPKKIFINYRRAQNQKDALLLEKALRGKFGPSRVFLDTSGLEGGKHWLHTLEAQVDDSVAMVSLIGKGWADAADENGARRLDDPDDFVRFEIARAFLRKIPVLPVLIDGAQMPGKQDLPRNLLPLLFPQAMPLRSESFDDDAQKIATRLKALIAEGRRAAQWRMPALAAALAVLGVGIIESPALLTTLGLRKPAPEQSEAAVKAPKKADEPWPMPDAPPVRKSPPPMPVTIEGRADKPLSDAEWLAVLKPKDSFKECPECPEMVVVPAGTFVMGSGDGKTRVAKLDGSLGDILPAEGNRDENEGPPHEVRFGKPFAVGRFAVTFAEWDACVAGGGCGGYKPDDKGWGRGDQPAINVSWNDAKAYVAWLSEKTRANYRLLSEAEREYVTRAGTTTPFWWGASISTQQAKYNDIFTSGGVLTGLYRGKTLSVKSFEANPFGLYQVHGNVFEWVEDCWHSRYEGAPKDGSAWITGGDCTQRILRGGAWGGDPQLLLAARRGWSGTEFRFDFFGVRVARTLFTPDL